MVLGKISCVVFSVLCLNLPRPTAHFNRVARNWRRRRDASGFALFEGNQNADVVTSCPTPRVARKVEVRPVVIGFVGANAPDLNSLNRDCLLLVVVKKTALADTVFQRFARIRIFQRRGHRGGICPRPPVFQQGVYGSTQGPVFRQDISITIISKLQPIIMKIHPNQKAAAIVCRHRFWKLPQHLEDNALVVGGKPEELRQ